MKLFDKKEIERLYILWNAVQYDGGVLGPHWKQQNKMIEVEMMELQERWNVARTKF